MVRLDPRRPISVRDYLAAELEADVKHEYFGCYVYALPEFTNRHNMIAGGFLGVLGRRLRDKAPQVFNSQTKVRIQTATQTRFYYPDGQVVCCSNPGHESFQDQPVVVAEVLSAATRRSDEVEKVDYYRLIPSLRVYLVIDQEEPRVVAHRRMDPLFVREEYTGLNAIIPLPEIGTELPLAELYDGVEFGPEPGDEEPRQGSLVAQPCGAGSVDVPTAPALLPPARGW